MIKVGATFNRYLFSSVRSDWRTPVQIIEALRTEFPFTLDAAASVENTVGRRYIDVETDALAQTWSGVVWCNPPYGRRVNLWLLKGAESADAGATVVFLLPARTDTKWFHEIVLPRAEVRFLRGRLNFSGYRSGAPFPSMLAIFHPPTEVDFL